MKASKKKTEEVKKLAKQLKVKTKKPKIIEPTKPDTPEEARKDYLRNRQIMLDEFADCLVEITRDKPSVDGIICGMDFRQFSANHIFFCINEQEDYIKYSEEWHPAYVDIEEEKAILTDMITQAKQSFGDQYDVWYDANKIDED
jgi:hypothetical protein